MWYVYIILTEKGKFYTGISTDPERRFKEHLSGKKGAKFFRNDLPVRIVYRENCLNRSSATKRELEIKKMTRSKKEQLVKPIKKAT